MLRVGLALTFQRTSGRTNAKLECDQSIPNHNHNIENQPELKGYAVPMDAVFVGERQRNKNWAFRPSD